MAHHNSTPASVLNAPTPTPATVWSPHQRVRDGQGRRAGWRDLGPFRGSVAALVGDPRAAQLGGRRKARHAANVAAQRAGYSAAVAKLTGYGRGA
jgi:hypothetical protein